MAPRRAPAEAWFSPALDSPNMSEASLAQLHRMAAAQGIDGAWVFKVGSATPEGRGSTFYPFFVSSIAAGLVPPFSEFFLSVLHHYNLQALHLHPNSVLLLAIFAYYCEAHIGVQPSVALLRHYFSLRVSRGSPSACASFVAYNGTIAISKPGKRIEGFRSKWVLTDVGRIHPRLILPKEPPTSSGDWAHAELTDPRAKPVLERMHADLRPASMAAAKLTGASLLKEFLEHQLAPLRQYSSPMWRPHPSPAALGDEDLTAVLQSLVGGEVARLEGAPAPLFLRDDWEQVVESMPVFNGDGPVPVAAPEGLVDVSSGDSGREEGEEEREKGPGSQATEGESRAPLPRHRPRSLRLSSSDDDEDDEQVGRSLPPIPKKDMTGLLSRGSVPAPRRAADTPPASGLPEGDPSSRLSGFKYGRRLLQLSS